MADNDYVTEAAAVALAEATRDRFDGLPSQFVSPTTLYVHPSGDDGNDGAGWTSAKATLAAASVALPSTGGEIIFAGTLVGPQVISKSGISVRGFGRTSVIQVTTNEPVLRVENCSRIRLSNFRALGTGNPASTSQRGVQMINVTDSIIDGLWVQSVGYDGILMLSGCARITVANCNVNGCGDDGINVGGDDVTATSGVVVASNVITDCGSSGIHLSDGSTGSVVVGNQTSDCGLGLDTRPDVHNNVIIGNICPDGINLLSNDNMLRGNTGPLTDSGEGNWFDIDQASDGWWCQRVADGVETIPRLIATSGAAATGSGNLRLSYFTAEQSLTAASVSLCSGTTAAAATPTLVRVGLYEVDVDGDLTLVASTANDTTLLAAANTLYSKTLSSPFGVVKGHRYAVGLIVVTAAAAPTVVGQFPGSATTAMSAIAPRLAGLFAGQSDLPSSVAAGSVANTTTSQWVALLA